MSELLNKANNLPTDAGCYLMKNSRGEVIYVGKAKNLKSRVKSYFDQSAKSPKTILMVSHVVDFEFMITRSEAESLILENNLIKEHTPKYNIRLRDDKSYPYVLVNYNEDFPRLEYVRRPKKKKNVSLFGPFPVGSNISMILRILTKTFALRDCSTHEFNTRKTPCLLYQMGQCTAPCVDYVDKNAYGLQLKQALQFFQGKKKALNSLNEIKNKMLIAAEKELFEHAAHLRDSSIALEQFLEKSYQQNVERLDWDENIDIVGIYHGETDVDLSIYMVRSGLLLGHRNYFFPKEELMDSEENELNRFLVGIYGQDEMTIPDKIVLSWNEGAIDLALALSTIAEKKINCVGKEKKYLDLIEMANKHAEETQVHRGKEQFNYGIGLAKLKELLGLEEIPRRLECYDVAVWQGKSPTASQIVFSDGKLDKARYRYYHLDERPEGNNDFAMIQELMKRRIPKGHLPDVFIIDGGKGQVSAFQKVLDDFGITLPVVGIAKAKTLDGKFSDSKVEKSEERLIIHGRANPYILGKCPSLMRIVVQMRDEAHRFSRKLHHKAEHDRLFNPQENDD